MGEPDLRANRLLSLLPDEDLARLEPHLTTVQSRMRDVIQPAGVPVHFCSFPLDAVLSVIVTDADGSAVEMATVGREGVVGLPGALAHDATIGEVITQLGGHDARIDVDAVRAEIDRRGAFFHVLSRYSAALFSQMAQNVLCVSRHPIESRAARWLLATQDRVNRDRFAMSQDFLAIMLGVSRPQVTLAAGALRRAGVIDYTRGNDSVRDRLRLESMSCECYRIIRDEFDRLLGDPAHPWVPVGG